MLDTRKKVLIVEDDPMVLELLTTRLELAGYRTTSARDGAVGLDAILQGASDGVILDLSLPKMDGFQVLEALQRQRPVKRPRIMVVTARNATEDVRRCLTLGAVDYLAKPFDDKVLLARVARLVAPPRRPGVPPVSL